MLKFHYILLYCILIIIGCNGNPNQSNTGGKTLIISEEHPKIMQSIASLGGSSTVGFYRHDASKIIANARISMTSILTITEATPGIFQYKMNIMTTDEMFGGVPKLKESNGDLNIDTIENNKWKFVGGEFGERGAYIEIPENGWQIAPGKLTIHFTKGRGNSMEFVRY